MARKARPKKPKAIKRIIKFWAVEKEVKETFQNLQKKRTTLDQAKIQLLFKEKAMMKGGRAIIVTVMLATDRENAISYTSKEELIDVDSPRNFDFLVIIAWDAWKRLGAKDKEQEFYHAICHMGYDAEKGPFFILHDFEGFQSEITKYGFQKPSHKEMAEAVQLRFSFEAKRDKGKTKPKAIAPKPTPIHTAKPQATKKA